MVNTPGGYRPVEDLNKGDLVWTLDAGLKPVKAMTRRKVIAPEGNDLPVRISKDALGMNAPYADMIVSRQHCFLFDSPIAERMFDERQVFVRAKDMLALDGVDIAASETSVTYIHILLDEHHVIDVNGCLSESVLKGEMVMRAVSVDVPPEIPARMIPNGSSARQLVARHIKNNQPACPAATNVKCRA